MIPTTIREGVLVGLAGAAGVALWFLVQDLAAGAPFRTPALLGAALFHGVRDAAAVEVTPGLVLGYTALHAAVFAVFGIVAAGLFALIDRERRVLFGVFILFCCFEVAAVLAAMVLAGWIVEELSVWSMLGANLLAAVVMLTLLFRRHHYSPQELLSARQMQ